MTEMGENIVAGFGKTKQKLKMNLNKTKIEQKDKSRNFLKDPGGKDTNWRGKGCARKRMCKEMNVQRKRNARKKMCNEKDEEGK